MGADLLIWALTWDRSRKLNWRAGRDRVIKLLNKDQEIEDASGIILTKENVLGYIEEVKAGVEGRTREGTILEILHMNVLVSGGMSWGDDPTELGNAIHELLEIDNSSILQAIGFDQDNIDYKDLVKKILKNKPILPTLLGLDKDLDKLIARELGESKHQRKM